MSAIRQPTDRLSDDIAAQVADRVRRGVCLQCQTELAKEKRVSRGLCFTCYSRSIQRIKRQQTTEAWLIANGFILAESSKGGRKSTRPDPVGELLASRDAITEADGKLKARTEADNASDEALAEDSIQKSDPKARNKHSKKSNRDKKRDT